ncbi:unnamed protein product [Spirodela intermedia]|uniref:Uncharacterized protein n=1 Tax=Spirodela intermedia TaxID=51605 RepID=A0A7I8LD50_SPIIN|nr:unnamed protein product [Spirodela intermedia]
MVWVPGLLKRRLCRYGNGARIFDESAFAGQNNEVPATPSDRAHGGASALLAVVLAPLSLLACFSRHPVDGTMERGEFSRVEIDHLRVNDGMRYAIYV